MVSEDVDGNIAASSSGMGKASDLLVEIGNFFRAGSDGRNTV